MPATTTRQSAAARSSRTASTRCSPATPTSLTTLTPAPNTRAVERRLRGDRRVRRAGRHDGDRAARGTGSGPRVTARATGSSDGVRGAPSRTASTACVGDAGWPAPPVRVRLVQGAAGCRRPAAGSCRRRTRPRGRRCAPRGRCRAARSRPVGADAVVRHAGGIYRLARRARSPARPLRLPRSRGDLHRAGAAHVARGREGRRCIPARR